MNRPGRVGVLSLALAALCSGMAFGQGPQGPEAGTALTPVTPEVIMKEESSGSVSYSSFSWMPDSRRVIFSATPASLRVLCRAGTVLPAGNTDPGKAERPWIAILDVQTRDCSFVHEGAYPKPSPDGKQVAFIYGETERPQIWISSIEGGNARALTSGSVFNPYARWPSADIYYRRAWSPDSRFIAYAMRPQAPNPPAANPAGGDTTVVVIGGKGDVGSDSELWVVEPATGTSRKLTSGPYHVWDELSWSPDSKTILFDCVSQVDARTDDIRGEVRTVSLATGEVRTIVKDHGVQMLRASFSPDGRMIAFTADPDNVYYPDHWNIALVPAQGGEIRMLTRDLFVSSDPIWSPNGDGVFFRVKKRVFSQIYFARTDGELKQLTDGARDSSRPVVSPDGRKMLLTTVDPISNRHLRLMNTDGSGEKIIAELSSPNRNLRLGQVEELNWKSRDGLLIAGFLVKPVGFDPKRKYPMVVDLHGGPIGGVGPGGSILLSRLELHMWANKGFLAFVPDYRSSGVYGWDQIAKARERQDANERDFDDIMSGVDHLVSQGFVDADRMALVGHSYGAFLTNWVITHDHRFRAAVSYEGYLDTFLMYGTGFRVGGNAAFEWLFKGTPWDVPDNYRRNSPLEFLKGIKTPTLLISGEKGMALYNNEFLYTALKKQKVDVKFLVYKGEDHVISAPANRRDLLNQVVDWIETHLGAGTAVACSSGSADMSLSVSPRR